MNARGRRSFTGYSWQIGEAQIFNSPDRERDSPFEHTRPKSNSQFSEALLHSPGIMSQQSNLKDAVEREGLLATEVKDALAEEVVEALLS